MKMRAMFILAFAAALSIGSVIALGADAPLAAVAAPLAAKAEIPKSDRWFVLVRKKVDREGRTRQGYLRITVKESGKVETPVEIGYEQAYQGGELLSMTAFCLNDKWLSPVQAILRDKIDQAEPATTWTIERPDPQSTTGKLLCKHRTGYGVESEVKEHTVLFYAPLDLVVQRPFDKENVLELAVIADNAATDCRLQYAGEKELEINGWNQGLHQFTLEGRRSTGLWSPMMQFWLNGKHELLRAEISGDILTPATEAEARKAAGLPPPEKTGTESGANKVAK